jgi:hypothetical protein
MHEARSSLAPSPLEFGDIPCFREFLTDHAKVLYSRVINVEDLVTEDGLDPTIAHLRYIYSTANIGMAVEPGPDDIIELAEKFNHGVSRGIFSLGVFGVAKWRRLAQVGPKSDRIIVIMHPFSSLPQAEISKTYGMRY